MDDDLHTAAAAAMKSDPAVKTGLADLAMQVRDHWRSLAPVFTVERGRRRAPPEGDVGGYRDSITVQRSRGGYRIITDDIKAHWIEFGSRHMPEYAPAQKTASAFGGEVQLGGALADTGIMNAQGKLRVAKAKLAEQRAVPFGSRSKLAAAEEAVGRATRARSAQFRARRRRRR